MKALIEHINREIEEYKLLIDVLHVETEALKKRDYKHILQIVAQKEALLSKIEKMGSIRRTLIEKTAERYHLPATISALLDTEGPERDELYRSVNMLRTLIESSIEINRVNRLTARASMENIQKMLNVLKNFIPHTTYNRNGTADEIDVRGIQLREGA